MTFHYVLFLANSLAENMVSRYSLLNVYNIIIFIYILVINAKKLL